MLHPILHDPPPEALPTLDWTGIRYIFIEKNEKPANARMNADTLTRLEIKMCCFKTSKVTCPQNCREVTRTLAEQETGWSLVPQRGISYQKESFREKRDRDKKAAEELKRQRCESHKSTLKKAQQSRMCPEYLKGTVTTPNKKPPHMIHIEMSSPQPLTPPTTCPLVPHRLRQRGLQNAREEMRNARRTQACQDTDVWIQLLHPLCLPILPGGRRRQVRVPIRRAHPQRGRTRSNGRSGAGPARCPRNCGDLKFAHYAPPTLGHACQDPNGTSSGSQRAQTQRLLLSPRHRERSRNRRQHEITKHHHTAELCGVCVPNLFITCTHYRCTSGNREGKHYSPRRGMWRKPPRPPTLPRRQACTPTERACHWHSMWLSSSCAKPRGTCYHRGSHKATRKVSIICQIHPSPLYPVKRNQLQQDPMPNMTPVRHTHAPNLLWYQHRLPWELALSIIA